jgi:SPP1 gp7 family putative phage head morphogenesis protein
MRAAFLDHLRRRALIEAKRDPSETPDWLDQALKSMSPEEVANVLWYEMHGDLDQGIEDAKSELSITGAFDVTPERALRYLADHVMDFADDMVTNERDGLRSLITDGLDQGWGAAKLGKNIRSYFRQGVHYVNNGTVRRTMNLDAWSDTVARTELSRAYNQGARSLYEEAGIKERVWMAAGEAHECPACEAADGEVAKIGDLFPSVDVEDSPAHPRCFCVTMASPDAIEKYNSPENVAARAELLARNRAFDAGR